MAVWVLKEGMDDSGHSLIGCRIVVTYSGGNATYRFLPPTGNGALGIENFSPLNMLGIPYDNVYWNVSSNTIPPQNPVRGTQWGGMCASYVREREDDPGTWVAEATGSGIEDEEFVDECEVDDKDKDKDKDKDE